MLSHVTLTSTLVQMLMIVKRRSMYTLGATLDNVPFPESCQADFKRRLPSVSKPSQLIRKAEYHLILEFDYCGTLEITVIQR